MTPWTQSCAPVVTSEADMEGRGAMLWVCSPSTAVAIIATRAEISDTWPAILECPACH